MSISQVLVLLLACVSLLQTQDVNILTNNAYQQPVYDSCDSVSCSHPDYPPSLVTDGSDSTYWRSNGEVTDEYQLTIQLAQEFRVSGINISFPLQLPTQWSVELSRDNISYQILLAYNVDCPDDSDRFCIRFDNNTSPQFFRTFGLTEYDSRAQFIRINLISIPADAEFYSVAEVAVIGECSCNGYGRSCLIPLDNSPYECRCTENTCGTHCEYCCEGYRDLDYVSRVDDPLFTCKRCDNCTNSLIQLLDSHTASFNQTADRFDSLTLTVSSRLDAIENFFSYFLPLYSQIIESLSITSAVELAIYGNYTVYSTPVEVSVIQCPISDLAVVDLYKSLLGYYLLLVPQFTDVSDRNTILSGQLDDQQQQLEQLSISITAFEEFLQEIVSNLAASGVEFKILAKEINLGFLQTKSDLSVIISNHFSINQTLLDTTDHLIRAIQWQEIIGTAVSSLREFNKRGNSIYVSLQSLRSQIELSIQITNNSISLFSEITNSRSMIFSFLSETKDLTENITVLVTELQVLTDSINSLFEFITEVLTYLDDCMYRLNKYNNQLEDRNVLLESLIGSIEMRLRLFLNTDVILSADEYILEAELYARNLNILYQQIILLARYVPDVSVVLSLNEQQLLQAIANAGEVVTARNRLNNRIAEIRNNNIFALIAEFRILVNRLSESADILINVSANILNTIKPHIDIVNAIEIILKDLKISVEELFILVNISIMQDEYSLSDLRTDLESRRVTLSAQESLVNSTITDLIDAQALLPDIAFYNNRTAVLRDEIVSELRTARAEQFNIAVGLNQLHWSNDNVKMRNSNIRSRLNKIYTRLSRVHNELQLPKAPLRLDGSMVVSLQPPPTEQLENATYSTDFSFYFEPVQNTISQDTFLFFYAGPAIIDTSGDTSVLGIDDFIAIVSTSGVMGYRARIGGRELSQSLDRSETIRSSSKYVVRIKRVGSAFRFELTTPTSLYTTTPILSEESLHNFVFRPTPNTAYYIGGHPDDVLIADSLQSLGKFRGCVYLALTLRWNLYSLWDTQYHTNILSDQSGLDCIRHSEIQNDFDVDGLSFNGYGHAYIRDLGQELSPQIKFSMTPQEHDGLILTAFGRNSNNKRFIFSFYLRDRLFHLDISYNGGDRRTYQSDLVTKVSTSYDIVLTLSGRVTAAISYENEETTLTTDVRNNLYNSDVLIFGGISPLAVDEASGALSGWTTDYYRNFTGCITHIFILRDSITDHILDPSFNLNADGTMGVSLGCANFPIPEYSVTKTHDTGYLEFNLLAHEGVTGSFTQFYHGENNFELLPGPIGSLSANPVDFSGIYSLGLIVSKPYFIGDKSVLIHLSDTDQGLVLEVSIDSTLNVTLEVTRGGVIDSVYSPLDLDKYRIMHSITVHSLGGSGLELYVDDNTVVTLSGAFNLVLPIELSANQNLFVGGNENPEYSFNGCLKEVALYDSLLNLGLATFVPTGTTSDTTEGIEHDMCGSHPFNGLVYGGARALTHPFDFVEAIRNSI